MGASVKHSSSSNEHMTPKAIVEAARELLGGIDTDPASSDTANKIVGATRYYTKEDNGFRRSLGGRIFLNPPGGICDDHGREVIRASGDRKPCTVTGACGLPKGHEHKGVRSSAAAWWFRLAEEWMSGNAMSALFVGFSIEILQSTQADKPLELIPLDFPMCVPSKRVRYITEQHGQLLPGTSPTHSSVLIWLPERGAKVDRFRELFGPFGKVVIP